MVIYLAEYCEREKACSTFAWTRAINSKVKLYLIKPVYYT